MTLTTEAPLQTQGAQVRFDPAGKPLAIQHDGRIWLVDPQTESQHWFARDPRRDTGRTAAAGCGDRAGSEFWRVQVRAGSNSALRTATLRRDPLATQWLLENVSG